MPAILFVALFLQARGPGEPEPSPDPPPDVLPGRWTLTVGDKPYDVTLAPDGQYNCYDYGILTYQGSWHFDRRSRRFVITESGALDSVPWPCRYRATLDRTLSGRTSFGTHLSLQRKE
jgi:hypothetical protein